VGINIRLTSDNGRQKQVAISSNKQIQVDYYLILNYNNTLLIGNVIQKTFGFLPHRNSIILLLLRRQDVLQGDRGLEVLIIYLFIN